MPRRSSRADATPSSRRRAFFSPRLPRRRSRAADAAAPAKFVKDPSFYARWSYAQPSDIIPYVRAVARGGDAEGVLAAMDVFGEYYLYKLGDEKGRILARLVRERAPRRSVEVGTFLGYSAIWTATNSRRMRSSCASSSSPGTSRSPGR